MDLFEKIGIKKYINAHDSNTIYGGSRMNEKVLNAMAEMAKYFVDMDELQEVLGEKIAKLTHNEGAYITNGASAGVLISSAACMAGKSEYRQYKLPNTEGLKNEIIVIRGQRNVFDKAIECSGAKIVEIGDADQTLEWELDGAINNNTAALFYFPETLDAKPSLPIEKVIEVCKKRSVYVIVDAAAQLPPVENLWNFTKAGADLVIFSGGKALSGPQSSGLILGKRELIDICKMIGAPHHGLARSSKVGREEMVGLYIAVEEYLSMDHVAFTEELEQRVKKVIQELNDMKVFKAERLYPGPVRQHYPRALARITADFKADELVKLMRNSNPGVYIGVLKDYLKEHENSIYISPLNLKDNEVEIVLDTLKICVKELMS
jgi:L-seryl-tRNA(Ser) seleniumtransferase